VKLYSYWRSSCAWRVRIALAWKNVPCEIVPVHLIRDGGQQKVPDFLARNPMGQVPVLAIDDPAGETTYLTQSMAIIEYLEERYPSPPLLPQEPRLRARARQLAEIVNSGIQPFQNLKLQELLRARGLDPAPVVRDYMLSGLRSLETLSRTTAGKFLLGDAPTYADVFLVPQLANCRRFGLDLETGEFPTLLRVDSTCGELPAFQAAHANAQPDRE